MSERQEERLHPSLGGRPWLGECFLWFVSFAPKEMNETLFASFSKKRSSERRVKFTSTFPNRDVLRCSQKEESSPYSKEQNQPY